MHGLVNDPHLLLLILFCAGVITIGATVTALGRIPRAKFAQLQSELKTLSERVGALEMAEEKRVLRKIRDTQTTNGRGQLEETGGSPNSRTSLSSKQI